MTISVEVMSVTSGSVTPAVQHQLDDRISVFYDTETLAIILRCKSKKSGLVDTTVWGWWGKSSQAGDKEKTKLNELARRYGTTLVSVSQYAEPVDMVRALGGCLAIRQGTRAHWSSENTTMHLVRCHNDLIFIDELELDVKNMCSGFSYCFSLLGTQYVWHGCGSVRAERETALRYARALTSSVGEEVVELSEGNDEDEMFWTILGDGAFAKADYWRWRPTIDPAERDARAWRVDASASECLSPAHAFWQSADIDQHVYVVDCVWEYYVVIGQNARGKRRDIGLGISVAKDMSIAVSSARPYSPNVHVVILPSQLPLDLKLGFRGIDVEFINQGKAPDHINILSSDEALNHMSTTLWDRRHLQNPHMLPLGVDISHI
ncbi:hypothetical protein FISHEDRAFT_43148 [Fistulina hepatica ATCC 64428]|uniref:Uncharacterized protein n=1 Tax=Fistulina hepatica ATCC 64428 TaxID=1128425 RepID=A0A0D7AD34_9AGAR|nr:hypothetical protein FISHEDRAFT_43148 [Fistulina hepatica ATCC 64428]